jgi:hypothetical protein
MFFTDIFNKTASDELLLHRLGIDYNIITTNAGGKACWEIIYYLRIDLILGERADYIDSNILIKRSVILSALSDYYYYIMRPLACYIPPQLINLLIR